MGICTNSLGVELARRADIVGVAERLGARLKKSGGEWIGPCPVCGGRDRFAINPRKGLFNCRGCGIGGDAIALVMHAEGCDFRKAVERLTDVRWRPLERGEA